MNLHTQHSHLHVQQRVVIQPVTHTAMDLRTQHTFTLNKEKLYSQSHTHSDEPSHSHLHTQQRVVIQPVTHMAINLHTQHSHHLTQQRVVIQPVSHRDGPSHSTKSSTTTWRLFNTRVCTWSSLNLLVWWLAGWLVAKQVSSYVRKQISRRHFLWWHKKYVYCQWTKSNEMFLMYMFEKVFHVQNLIQLWCTGIGSVAHTKSHWTMNFWVLMKRGV